MTNKPGQLRIWTTTGDLFLVLNVKDRKHYLFKLYDIVSLDGIFNQVDEYELQCWSQLVSDSSDE